MPRDSDNRPNSTMRDVPSVDMQDKAVQTTHFLNFDKLAYSLEQTTDVTEVGISWRLQSSSTLASMAETSFLTLWECCK